MTDALIVFFVYTQWGVKPAGFVALGVALAEVALALLSTTV